MAGGHFVLVDGDEVGEKIDLLVLRTDLAGLTAFTRSLDAAVQRIAEICRELRGEVYMAGGDNVLARVDDIDRFLGRFLSATVDFPCTFSVGIGSDARQAHNALQVAKAFASGTVVRSTTADGEVGFLRRVGPGTWVKL